MDKHRERQLSSNTPYRPVSEYKLKPQNVRPKNPKAKSYCSHYVTSLNILLRAERKEQSTQPIMITATDVTSKKVKCKSAF